MPKVGNKKFSYTAKGKKAAKKYWKANEEGQTRLLNGRQ